MRFGKAGRRQKQQCDQQPEKGDPDRFQGKSIASYPRTDKIFRVVFSPLFLFIRRYDILNKTCAADAASMREGT